jgi:hypothetical protein
LGLEAGFYSRQGRLHAGAETNKNNDQAEDLRHSQRLLENCQIVFLKLLYKIF